MDPSFSGRPVVDALACVRTAVKLGPLAHVPHLYAVLTEIAGLALARVLAAPVSSLVTAGETATGQSPDASQTHLITVKRACSCYPVSASFLYERGEEVGIVHRTPQGKVTVIEEALREYLSGRRG